MSTTKPLVELVGTVTVPPTTVPFVARDVIEFYLSHNKLLASGVRVHLGHGFIQRFFGKTEEPLGGSSLTYDTLTRPAHDGSVIEELGGEEHVETKLSEVLALLGAQEHGQAGPLLTNGYVNIFYVRAPPEWGNAGETSRDVAGVLCAVVVSRNTTSRPGNWRLNACAVGSYEWIDNSHVFART